MTIPTSLKIFKGKRVLLTGDTGFKGSWLAFWLKELGADLVGLALPPQGDVHLFGLLGLAERIHHVDADIREIAGLRRVFDDFKPEFVFHLAAQALVRLSYQEPKATFDTNVGGSLNLLECVRHCSATRSVIYVTTDKCYKNNEWLWGYRENDELGGKDPYSASKAAAEILFASYRSSFFGSRQDLGISSVRAGNVVGGGDWALDRVVPDCMRALSKGEEITVRNPAAIRPWQHVLDPLHGYLFLAAKQYAAPDALSGSWNFGPDSGSNRTVKDLVERVVFHWGSGEYAVAGERNAPHEATLLQLNCDKAKQILGWQPVWDFERTIHKTVEWYKAYHEGKPVAAATKHQIEEFMGDCGAS